MPAHCFQRHILPRQTSSIDEAKMYGPTKPTNGTQRAAIDVRRLRMGRSYCGLSFKSFRLSCVMSRWISFRERCLTSWNFLHLVIRRSIPSVDGQQLIVITTIDRKTLAGHVAFDTAFPVNLKQLTPDFDLNGYLQFDCRVPWSSHSDL